MLDSGPCRWRASSPYLPLHPSTLLGAAQQPWEHSWVHLRPQTQNRSILRAAGGSPPQHRPGKSNWGPAWQEEGYDCQRLLASRRNVLRGEETKTVNDKSISWAPTVAAKATRKRNWDGPKLVPTGLGSRLRSSLPNSAFSDVTLGAWNQPGWKYLHTEIGKC